MDRKKAIETTQVTLKRRVPNYHKSRPGRGFYRHEVTNEAGTLLPLLPTDRDLRGAEIGVYMAKTASIMLFRRPRLHLYLVDSWEVLPETMEISMAHLQDVPGVKGRYTVLHGDSTEMAQNVEDGSLDYAFIDASKELEKYEADIRAWLPKVKADGFISGHDLHHPGIEELVRSMFPNVQTNDRRHSWWSWIS
jgi:predicted O-methyltransferase YrrM